MKKQVKFKNGFNAIFSGTLVQTYLSRDKIKHHKIINRKLIEKSNMDPFIIDGVDVINTSDEETILDAHLITKHIPIL